jgi:hypothetical protein
MLNQSIPGGTLSKSLRGGPFLPIYGLDHFADGILQALQACAQNEFRLTVAPLLVVELHCAESYFVITLSSRFKFAIGRRLTLKQFGLQQRNARSRRGARAGTITLSRTVIWIG